MPELGNASRELVRTMASPTQYGWQGCRRVGEFLRMGPRVLQELAVQGVVNRIDAFSDSNWAGCHSTRTGCSVLFHGTHTQQFIAPSSAEAEYYGRPAGASEVELGIAALASMTPASSSAVQLERFESPTQVYPDTLSTLCAPCRRSRRTTSRTC